jgi:hypothetical protein
MGKGTILENLGEGRYVVDLDYGVQIKEEKRQVLNGQSTAKLGQINAKQLEYDNKEAGVIARQQELNVLIDIYSQAFNADPQADYTAQRAEIQDKINELQPAAAELDAIRTELADLKADHAQIQRELGQLNAVGVRQTFNTWCADYSPDAAGQVATIEIPGEPQAVVIAPGARAPTAADGDLRARGLLDPNQAYYNAAILPGWQRWKPTFRKATVLDLNASSQTLTVLLDDDVSSAQRLPVNFDRELSGVPVEYMECGFRAFDIGDRVVVQFEGMSWDSPKVIGFVSNPRSCPIFLNWTIGGGVYKAKLSNLPLVIGSEQYEFVNEAALGFNYSKSFPNPDKPDERILLSYMTVRNIHQARWVERASLEIPSQNMILISKAGNKSFAKSVFISSFYGVSGAGIKKSGENWKIYIVARTFQLNFSNIQNEALITITLDKNFIEIDRQTVTRNINQGENNPTSAVRFQPIPVFFNESCTEAKGMFDLDMGDRTIGTYTVNEHGLQFAGYERATIDGGQIYAVDYVNDELNYLIVEYETSQETTSGDSGSYTYTLTKSTLKQNKNILHEVSFYTEVTVVNLGGFNFTRTTVFNGDVFSVNAWMPELGIVYLTKSNTERISESYRTLPNVERVTSVSTNGTVYNVLLDNGVENVLYSEFNSQVDLTERVGTPFPSGYGAPSPFDYSGSINLSMPLGGGASIAKLDNKYIFFAKRFGFVEISGLFLPDVLDEPFVEWSNAINLNDFYEKSGSSTVQNISVMGIDITTI